MLTEVRLSSVKHLGLFGVQFAANHMEHSCGEAASSWQATGLLTLGSHAPFESVQLQIGT